MYELDWLVNARSWICCALAGERDTSPLITHLASYVFQIPWFPYGNFYLQHTFVPGHVQYLNQVPQTVSLRSPRVVGPHPHLGSASSLPSNQAYSKAQWSRKCGESKGILHLSDIMSAATRASLATNLLVEPPHLRISNKIARSVSKSESKPVS